MRTVGPEEERPRQRHTSNEEERPRRRGRAEPEDDDELKSKPKRLQKVTEVDTPKCPAGGKYGRDANEFDECEDCPYWEGCAEMSEKARDEKRPHRRSQR